MKVQADVGCSCDILQLTLLTLAYQRLGLRESNGGQMREKRARRRTINREQDQRMIINDAVGCLFFFCSKLASYYFFSYFSKVQPAIGSALTVFKPFLKFQAIFAHFAMRIGCGTWLGLAGGKKRAVRFFGIGSDA